jgi:hypothetical protein
MQIFKKFKFYKINLIQIKNDFYCNLSNGNDFIELSAKSYYRIEKKDFQKFEIKKEQKLKVHSPLKKL